MEYIKKNIDSKLIEQRNKIIMQEKIINEFNNQKIWYKQIQIIVGANVYGARKD